jgi:hypothetical protein
MRSIVRLPGSISTCSDRVEQQEQATESLTHVSTQRGVPDRVGILLATKSYESLKAEQQPQMIVLEHEVLD